MHDTRPSAAPARARLERAVLDVDAGLGHLAHAQRVDGAALPDAEADELGRRIAFGRAGRGPVHHAASRRHRSDFERALGARGCAAAFRAAHDDRDLLSCSVQREALPDVVGQSPGAVGGVDDQIVLLDRCLQPNLEERFAARGLPVKAGAQPVHRKERAVLGLGHAWAAPRAAARISENARGVGRYVAIGDGGRRKVTTGAGRAARHDGTCASAGEVTGAAEHAAWIGDGGAGSIIRTAVLGSCCATRHHHRRKQPAQRSSHEADLHLSAKQLPGRSSRCEITAEMGVFGSRGSPAVDLRILKSHSDTEPLARTRDVYGHALDELAA